MQVCRGGVKMKYKIYILKLAVISLLWLPSVAITAELTAQKWEYKVIRAGDFEGNAPIDKLDQWQNYKTDKMNEMGKQGWELVSVSRGEGLEKKNNKRQKKQKVHYS